MVKGGIEWVKRRCTDGKVGGAFSRGDRFACLCDARMLDIHRNAGLIFIHSSSSSIDGDPVFRD